jgi:hypothetical protein
MTDLAKPRSLSKVTENVGFTMADVAFVSGLDESTVCRLWDAADWLDRISGRSLQCLVASVPGVAEYFASYSVLARRQKLVAALQTEGLVVNQGALHLSATTGVPHQYLVNALEAALCIMRGDSRRASSYLARFWGLQQNRALEALYSTSPATALLANPDQLFAASVAMMPLLARKSYSYHSILARATFAHHIGIATGELSDDFAPRIRDRQSAFMARSGVMGLLINSSNTELARRYERMVKETPVLAVVEEWSFPTYTRDSKPNSDFSLPRSLLLRNTASEVLREITDYTDAYLYYLSTTYLPLALERDSTFGLQRAALKAALLTRINTCQDADVRTACASLAGQL